MTARRAQRDYEKEFADALCLLGWHVITYAEWKKSKIFRGEPNVVVSQFMPHPPSAETGELRNWKCDFAVPTLLVSCEIDGFAGDHSEGAHRTWGGFHRDREKGRDLAFQGWRTLSYGPADLRSWNDVLRCADEFIRFCRKCELFG